MANQFEVSNVKFGGELSLPVSVKRRTVPQRMVLTIEAESTLSEVSAILHDLTQRIFEELAVVNAELTDHLYVEFFSRSTENVPGHIALCAPVAQTFRPSQGFGLAVDGSHDEAYVPLTQDQTTQPFIISVHDFMSAGSFADDVVPVGNNREIYFPTFATGVQDEPVMEIAVPIAAATTMLR